MILQVVSFKSFLDSMLMVHPVSRCNDIVQRLPFTLINVGFGAHVQSCAAPTMGKENV
jgi:hypothetical protein